MDDRTETIDLSQLAAARGSRSFDWTPRDAHWLDLVRSATAKESGREHRTPLRCRKRPGGKACTGWLMVRRRDVPLEVAWHCPRCGTAGVIKGFEGSVADLRSLGRSGHADEVVAPISAQALAALVAEARDEDSLAPLAHSASVDEDGDGTLHVDRARLSHWAMALQQRAFMTRSRRRGDGLGEAAMALGQLGGGPRVGGGFVPLDPSGAATLLGGLMGRGSLKAEEFVPHRPRPRPRSTCASKAGTVQTYRIKVTLRDVRPPVWRRLIVPSDIELPRLHEVLQSAMGWTDSHLHAFRVGNEQYAPASEYDMGCEDSNGVRLDTLVAGIGGRLIYEYDFGDCWTHDILVEEVIDQRCTEVRCLKGARACPPEDCGGPWGYSELLQALADTKHERHTELKEWHGGEIDPEEFDLVETDARVRSVPLTRRGSRR